MQKFEDSHERCSNVEPHVSTNSRHQILKLLKVLNIYLFVSFNTLWNKIEKHIFIPSTWCPECQFLPPFISATCSWQTKQKHIHHLKGTVSRDYFSQSQWTCYKMILNTVEYPQSYSYLWLTARVYSPEGGKVTLKSSTNEALTLILAAGGVYDFQTLNRYNSTMP